MNPSHLITLATIARTGSLTAASSALGRTQPAISAHVRELAEAVGSPLLLRQRYGVTLTRQAEALLPYAEACLRALEGARQTALSLRGLETGRLHILTSTSDLVYVLPQVCIDFRATYPGVEINLFPVRLEAAIAALKRGDGDLAIIRGDPEALSAMADTFRVRRLLPSPTVLVVRPDHPLAGRTRVSMAELDGLEIVTRESGSITQQKMDKLARAFGINFRVKSQTVAVEGLKEAVLQGLGAIFVSRTLITREVAMGTLVAVPLETGVPDEMVLLIYGTSGECPPAVDRFVPMLVSAVNSLVASHQTG